MTGCILVLQDTWFHWLCKFHGWLYRQVGRGSPPINRGLASSMISLVTWSWVEQGLTPHQTHYRSYRDGFIGQKTQPTVWKHWRKRSPKDQASIPLGPPHCADNNTTQKKHKIQINTTKSRLCTQCDKTQSLVTCTSVCVVVVLQSVRSHVVLFRLLRSRLHHVRPAWSQRLRLSGLIKLRLHSTP